MNSPRRSICVPALMAIASAGAIVLSALLPAVGRADPQVLRMTFSKPPVVGRSLDLLVRAVDPEAPVSGSVTTFGDGHSFGTSACRPDSSSGRAPGAPFAAGAPVTISTPQVYSRAGKAVGLLRLDSGGCGGLTGSVLQPFTATPAAPGQNPGGLVLLPPVPVQVGPGSPPPPKPPGTGSLPPLPPLPPVPPLPVPPLPPLPPPPGGGLPLPPPPPLPVAAASGRATVSKSACRGARRKVGRTRRSRRRARRAMLCLINRERLKRGLQLLTSQRRLFEASFRHSRAMVARGFFAHVEPGGVGLVTRLVRVRYLPKHGWTVGENIAWGTGRMSTPRSIVRAWMHSTGHRANILNPAFREIGLGVHRGVPAPSRVAGGTFTTDFGFRR